MGTLDADMAERLLGPLRGLGVDVRLDTPVGRLRARQGAPPRRRRARRRPGGARARRHAQRRAGRRRRAPSAAHRGALKVDRRQRTTLDGVYAAGDCCESHHLVSGRPIHVALGTVANKQGRVAGINLGGGYATFPGVVGTAITKVCSLEVGAHRAHRAGGGRRPASTPSPPPSRARPSPATCPTPSRWRVKLVAERGTGRLLGGQIVGEERSGEADRHRSPSRSTRGCASRSWSTSTSPTRRRSPPPGTRSTWRPGGSSARSDRPRRLDLRRLGHVSGERTGGSRARPRARRAGRSAGPTATWSTTGSASSSRRRKPSAGPVASPWSRSGATGGPSSACSPTSTSCSSTPGAPTSARWPIASGTRSGTRA